MQAVAGAYLLVKPRPPLAPGVLTASACLADIAPNCWAIEWVKVQEGEREESAARLGIRAEDLPAVIQWATDHFARGSFGWPNVFLDLEAAWGFRRRFLSPEIHLLGIALPLDLVDHPWLIEEYPA